MQETSYRRNDKRDGQVVQADVLGNTRISSPMLENLVHPDATPPHHIPQENEVEVALSKVENLISKGYYGAALREAKALKIDSSTLASHYDFLTQEKISRAYIGIADRYFIRGNNDGAKQFYERAIKPDTTNATVAGIAALAEQTFDELVKQRQSLFDGLKNDISQDSYADWCEKKNRIQTTTIIDVTAIRASIFPDFTLEGVFGELPPIQPTPGWIDPLPPETEFIDFASVTPASVFEAETDRAVNVDVTIPTLAQAQAGEVAQDNRIRASVVMPIIANVLTAKVRLFAIERGLTLTGQVQGVVPLFRYEYLRDKAKEIISHIQDIESRMLPIQFKLDDFAEVVSTIRLHLAEQEAELEAANQKINQLMQTLTVLAQAEKEMDRVVRLIVEFDNQCDCDWWCWLTFGLGALAAVIGFALAAVATGGLAAVGAIVGVGAEFLAIKEITCDNAGQITTSARSILAGLQQAISENEAELNHELAVRDILTANINALSHELTEAYASNAARVLNAGTLNVIQAQYDTIRQSLFTRAQAIAKLAEEAFNFERDSEVHLIKDSYADGLHQDKKGYTHAETLLRDLEGLDYIDITGRTRKAVQLSHVVSLRKHYPESFPSILAIGKARFVTDMKDFDRWFPGTYMQRIKEVRVEVLVDSEPVPARGYISNDGVSFVRFSDPGNKREVDDVHVFAEPDADVAQLCFKRFQRRRHVDTMAFPDFVSYLHEDRMRKLQDRERNFFENVGPESTWVIELLPDQPFDFSKITDVRMFFQYEAFFDENLKRVLEKKRYAGRRESITLSVKNLLEREGRVADFSDTVTVNVSRSLFEAPAIDKKIVNVGFVVKPKGTAPLNGVAKLEVTFQGATPNQVETNNQGILATATDHPAGSDLAGLEAMAHGKNIDGTWTIKIVELPSGLGVDAIDDIFLLLNYEYVP